MSLASGRLGGVCAFLSPAHQNCSEADFQRQHPFLAVYPYHRGRYRVSHRAPRPLRRRGLFVFNITGISLNINTVTRVFGSKGRMALQRIRSFAFSFVPKHWHRLIFTRQLRLWVPPTSPELLPDVVKGAVRASNARGDQLFVCDCPR